jgi:hypothetical protein
MALSSVSVVCSSLLLRRYTRPHLADLIAAADPSDKVSGTPTGWRDRQQNLESGVEMAQMHSSKIGDHDVLVLAGQDDEDEYEFDGDDFDDGDADADQVGGYDYRGAMVAMEDLDEPRGVAEGSRATSSTSSSMSAKLQTMVNRVRGRERKKDGVMYATLLPSD